LIHHFDLIIERDIYNSSSKNNVYLKMEKIVFSLLAGFFPGSFSPDV